VTHRIIFLDIDGVLNSNAWYERFGYQHIPRPPLDRDAVRRLDRIVRATGAFLVISSSWRGDPRLSSWLMEHGCSGVVVGRTPRIAGVERGIEIAHWLRLNARSGIPIRSFVILDDGDDMAGLQPWLVQTTQEYGLQDDDVDRAITLLRGPA
jgi:hypothetical protein